MKDERNDARDRPVQVESECGNDADDGDVQAGMGWMEPKLNLSTSPLTLDGQGSSGQQVCDACRAGS